MLYVYVFYRAVGRSVYTIIIKRYRGATSGEPVPATTTRPTGLSFGFFYPRASDSFFFFYYYFYYRYYFFLPHNIQVKDVGGQVQRTYKELNAVA